MLKDLEKIPDDNCMETSLSLKLMDGTSRVDFSSNRWQYLVSEYAKNLHSHSFTKFLINWQQIQLTPSSIINQKEIWYSSNDTIIKQSKVEKTVVLI